VLAAIFPNNSAMNNIASPMCNNFGLIFSHSIHLQPLTLLLIV
jgi:hypothetical protein